MRRPAGGWLRRCLPVLGSTVGLAVAGLQFGCGAPQKAPGAQGGPSPESRTARALASVRDDRAELERFLATFPVGGDLHHHLGGSVPVEHLIRMATDRGLCLPRSEDTVWALVAPAAGGCPAGARPVAEAAVDETFRAEIEGRWTMRKYLSNAPSVDRQAANDHFFDSFGKFTPALDDFPRTLAVVRNAAAAQGTLYIETSTGGRAGPALALAVEAVRWSEDFGALRERLLESAEFQRARERSVDAFATVLERSEEILGCETPAAQPGCDVFVRLQVHAMRTSSPVSVFAQTLLSYEVSSRLPEVVGINLVAPEHDPVSVRDYDLHMKMHATLGPLYPDVGRALHAAEFSEEQARRLGTTDHLEKALSVARAQRIGHGVSLDAEQRRAWVLETLRERGVAVELNLRSNEELLGVLGRDHPLPDYLAAGVPIVLSTDDAGLMLTTQREQFRLALQYPEVGYAELKRFAYNSLRYSFLADGDEERLVRRLDEQFREFEGRF